MKHNCHAIGCNKAVPPKHLFCREHWRNLPLPLQLEVEHYYRKGQERTKKVTREYYRASLDAINYIAISEGKTPIDIEKRMERLKRVFD